MSPEVMGGDGAVLEVELERAEGAGLAGRSVILVEGTSDQRAVETLAKRKRRDLDAEGVEVIPTTGATNLGRFLELLGPKGYNVPIGGLCDEAEGPVVAVCLEDSGMGSDLKNNGFYVCHADLEEELIRALGTDRMEALMASQGHLRRFRSFQNQPAQRHKTIEQQIWRWLGNHKIPYAPLMVSALDMTKVPRPLELVLTRA